MSDIRKYFFEIHTDLPREAPGSDSSTLKALTSLPPFQEGSHIADIGCGPGRSALALAKTTGAVVEALDLHHPYLDHLSRVALDQGLDDRIKTVQGDMNALPFPKDHFDLIWSEGAIYIAGFESGLMHWRQFLKDGGHIAVTHISWLTGTPSKEASEFWNDAYPAIRGIDENLSVMKRAGFEPLGHFPLPMSDWWDEYYSPMENRIADMRKRYADIPDAQTACAESQKQIDLWKDHGADYGYVFYLGRKIASP